MIEFGPNKTRSHSFCLKITFLLFFIALLAFATSFLLILSKDRLESFIFKNRTLITNSEQLLVNSGKFNKLSSSSSSSSSISSSNATRCSITTISELKQPTNELTNDEITVKTRTGNIVGFRKRVFNKNVNIFLGVPYAKKPIGKLRFRRTKPLDASNETIHAKKFQANCVQYYDERLFEVFTPYTHEMLEDCLYLNIWSPNIISNDNNSNESKILLPVMVWVHGGGFSEGTANIEENNGEILSSYGDVIVISLNYRLGVLGFFDLGIDESPGNQGLYDQITAFIWIKENIEKFGGDPKQITLFGVSAGAMAIGLHMTSPESKNLFKRAIFQSGSPIVVDSFYSKTSEIAQKVAEKVDCIPDELLNMERNETEEVEELPIHVQPQKVLNCLMKQNATDFVSVQKHIVKDLNFAFTPSPYENLLPLMPTDAIREQTTKETFSNIDEVLIGLTKDEASVFLYLHDSEKFGQNITINITSLEELKEFFVDLVMTRNVKRTQATFIADSLLKGTGKENSTLDYIKLLYTAIGDLAFNCPSLIFAQEMAKINKKAYFYVFNQRPTGIEQLAEWMGVPHLTTMIYVFGFPLRYPTRFSGADIDTSKRVMKAWSQFAHTGTMGDEIGTFWKPFSFEKEEYAEINKNGAVIKERYHWKTCDLYRIAFDTFNR